MKDLKIILGILCTAIIIIKILIHRYLDKKNNYAEKSFVTYRINFLFLLPYYNVVSDSHRRIKLLCNMLWIFFLCLMILLVIF